MKAARGIDRQNCGGIGRQLIDRRPRGRIDFQRIRPGVIDNLCRARRQDYAGICSNCGHVIDGRGQGGCGALRGAGSRDGGRNTDTGLQPWPWSVNQAGQGHWFKTPEEAVDFVEDQLDLGLRNFDVGCFQLNHRWHSKGFHSTIDMFDPVSNATYAAQFLNDLFAEKGDWSLAAAAYHSRTPDFAERYQAKFDAILASLTDQPFQAATDTPQIQRSNRFPLLQAGVKGNVGSIVPRLSAASPLIGYQP